LLPGHYGRSCRNTDVACNACPGKHHSLIHGAERVFPGKPQPKGKATISSLIRINQTKSVWFFTFKLNSTTSALTTFFYVALSCYQNSPACCSDRGSIYSPYLQI
jgi:hypothetical protein